MTSCQSINENINECFDYLCEEEFKADAVAEAIDCLVIGMSSSVTFAAIPLFSTLAFVESGTNVLSQHVFGQKVGSNIARTSLKLVSYYSFPKVRQIAETSIEVFSFPKAKNPPDLEKGTHGQ